MYSKGSDKYVENYAHKKINTASLLCVRFGDVCPKIYII